MEKESVELIKDLDGELLHVLVNIETLEDVRMELSNLRGEMYGAKSHYYPVQLLQYHQTVRILDDLLFYTVKDLEQNYQRVSEIVEQLYNKIARPPM